MGNPADKQRHDRMIINKQMNRSQQQGTKVRDQGHGKYLDYLRNRGRKQGLTLRISSCTRCFFVSLDEPLGLSFLVQRSLYKISKLGLRCSTAGSIGGSMAFGVLIWCNLKVRLRATR